MTPTPRRAATIRRSGALGIAALVMVASACAPVEGDDIGGPIFDGTTPEGEVIDPPITTLPPPEIDAIRVPLDHFSIQDAVNAAQPGDLVLVDPGVYTEEIVITTPDIVVRGRDRNTVFIDGIHDAGTGVTVRADGVAIENLTVRNYRTDAIAVTATADEAPIDGFRALHITTSNTGANGIVARNAVNVEIREVWASGHGGAGIAIESCDDCRTLVEITLAEFSARGMSIVDAVDGVVIVRSTSRNNRAGIVIEDGPGAGRGTIVAGSVILNNGFATTPLLDPDWDRAFGVGVHVAGTEGTRIERNRLAGNLRAGVLLSNDSTGSTADPVAASVTGNEVQGHPEGDVVLALTRGVVDPGLCVVDNALDTIAPAGAEAAARCTEVNEAPPPFTWTATPSQTIPYQNGPVPPGIEGLPDADSAPAIPAGPVPSPALGDVVVPAV